MCGHSVSLSLYLSDILYIHTKERYNVVDIPLNPNKIMGKAMCSFLHSTWIGMLPQKIPNKSYDEKHIYFAYAYYDQREPYNSQYKMLLIQGGLDQFLFRTFQLALQASTFTQIMSIMPTVCDNETRCRSKHLHVFLLQPIPVTSCRPGQNRDEMLFF